MTYNTHSYDLPNSTIAQLIDEHIHNSAYRNILKDRLINDLSFSELADKYDYSERHLKSIVYKASERLFSKLA